MAMQLNAIIFIVLFTFLFVMFGWIFVVVRLICVVVHILLLEIYAQTYINKFIYVFLI